MKIITYRTKIGNKAGILEGKKVLKIVPALKEYFLSAGSDERPSDKVEELLAQGMLKPETLKALLNWLKSGGHEDKFTEKEEWVIAAPLMPGKIIALGRNYAAHAKEQNAPLPKEPIFFGKASSSVIGAGENVVYWDFIKKEDKNSRVDHEVELAVVIGKKAKQVKKKNAMDYVFGYAIINDVTARSIQNLDFKLNQPWFRSKSIDTFCPLGPWIVTKDEIKNPHNLKLECKVNGNVKQKGSTQDFIFKLPEVIEYLTKYITLMPGDVISTGTPDGISPVKPGDVMECFVEKIGTLVNKVISEKR